MLWSALPAWTAWSAWPANKPDLPCQPDKPDQPDHRVANCALWFLKLPRSEAKEQAIYNVNILGGSSSVLELLETIWNFVGLAVHLQTTRVVHTIWLDQNMDTLITSWFLYNFLSLQILVRYLKNEENQNCPSLSYLLHFYLVFGIWIRCLNWYKMKSPNPNLSVANVSSFSANFCSDI